MLLYSLLLGVTLLSAESADSLSGAVVTADRGAVVSRLDTLSISFSKSSVASLANLLPGLLLSDYGSLSGGKTVSLRGLGASHTAIYVDGLKVSNLQTGQSDLGLLDLSSFGSALVDYAQNSVSFLSAAPSFSGGKSFSGTASFEGGSFGTYIPRASTDFRLSPRVSLRTSLGAVLSNGDYSYAGGARRQNNDIRQIRGGVDLFGTLEGGVWRAKAYINSSDRGTPGSISWPAEDRQNDLMSFVQGTFRRSMSELYSLELAAKGSWDRILFESAWGDSDYHQGEYQIHSTHRLDIAPWLKTSLVAGAEWTSLRSSLYDASRWSAELSGTASLILRRFHANLELAYNGYYDHGQVSRNYLTPSADLSFVPFEGMKITGFVRRAPRVPNFNELYYVGYGNPNLKAEDAFLSDIGVEWHRTFCGGLGLGAKADAFFNVLKDKIGSAPTKEDPNVWLPYNIGKVFSSGLDASVDLSYERGETGLRLTARYCLLDAEDRTPGSLRQQIPYVSRHSLSLGAYGGYRHWGADMRWTFRSSRRDSSGPLPQWNTLDVTLGREIALRGGHSLKLKADLENVCSQRYELVRDYPMSGFGIRGGVVLKF